jgi:DNA-binding response OmpR family regulator
MKILVIEDDPLAAQALTTILSAHHYAVETTGNASDGAGLLNSFEYDLLILDVELPEINGIELCRQIRTNEQSSESSRTIPILLLTGRASFHDRAMGLDAGADDYMVKPFNEEELLARVRSVLRRSNSSSSSPSLDWGSLHLDPSACEVNYDRILLILTPKEYALLELFLRNSRRVFSCSNIFGNCSTQ